MCISGVIWFCELPLRLFAPLFIRLLLEREMVMSVLAWQECYVMVSCATSNLLSQLSKHLTSVGPLKYLSDVYYCRRDTDVKWDEFYSKAEEEIFEPLDIAPSRP